MPPASATREISPPRTARTTNAFSTMMQAAKQPLEKVPSRTTTATNPSGFADAGDRPSIYAGNHTNATSPFSGRNGLGAYLQDPASYPDSRILYFNDEYVAIHDMYPKSTVHKLLLPRNMNRTLVHPFDAFKDAEFLAKVKVEVEVLKKKAAAELRDKYSKFSKQDIARQEALRSKDPDVVNSAPPGRDWTKELLVGVHAGPSMNHLHVHVLSKDRISPALTYAAHYNSFQTSFLVRLDEFPLSNDDPRWQRDRGGGLEQDLVCYRCGKNFRRQFAKLKAHLEEEFEGWKRE